MTKRDPRARAAFTPGEKAPSQTDDGVQPPALTGAEWKVEKILETRKRGRGNQVLVKWVGFAKTTWEPLKNLLKTEALHDYEEQHGKIAP